MTDNRPILIVGLPRSGTTWIGEVFASSSATSYIFEPDNEGLSPIAWLCKRDLHRFPYLTSTDNPATYHQLWQTVLHGRTPAWIANEALGLLLRRRASQLEAAIGDRTGLRYIDRSMHRVGPGKPSAPYLVETHALLAYLTRQLLLRGNPGQGKRVVVKSVHSVLSLDWVASHFPIQAVIVLRNPYSLYASYKRLRIPDSFRNVLLQQTLQRDIGRYVPSNPLALMPEKEDPLAFQIALMYKIIECQISAHPEWTLISHDRLCIAPHEGYRHLLQQLGLQWSGKTGKQINALNRKGDGFAPRRISQIQPEKWKNELTGDEQMAVDRWSNAFNLGSFFEERVNPQ